MGLGSIGTYDVVKACRILDYSLLGKRLAVDVANFGYKWYHTGADIRSQDGLQNLRQRVFGFMALAKRRGVMDVTFVFDGEPLALKMEVTHKKRRAALKRGKQRAEDKCSTARTLFDQAKAQLDDLCRERPTFIRVEPAELAEPDAVYPEAHFGGEGAARRVLAAVADSLDDDGMRASPATAGVQEEAKAPETTEVFVPVDDDGTAVVASADDRSQEDKAPLLLRDSPLFVAIADELQVMRAMQVGDVSILTPTSLTDLFARSQETMQVAIERAERQASRPCNAFFDRVRELALEAGAKVRTAADEAERECALMTRRGEADAAVSEDYDTLAFGATLSIMQFGKNDEFGLRSEDVRAALGMTVTQFHDYGILCGCDYVTKPHGSGPKKGHNWLRAHGSIEAAADVLQPKLKGVTWADFLRMVIGARGIFSHDEAVLEAQREEARRMKHRDNARLAVFTELMARQHAPAMPPTSPAPASPTPAAVPRAAVPAHDCAVTATTITPSTSDSERDDHELSPPPPSKRPRTATPPAAAPALGLHPDLALLEDEPE